jgi:hypothetical protein
VVLGAEYSYLSDNGILMYLANNTSPDNVFTINCDARHSASLSHPKILISECEPFFSQET